MGAKIYIADWTFETKSGLKLISKDIVTKKLPIEFIISEGLSYQRALKPFSEKQRQEMIEDRKTGLKKFTIKFIKFIGNSNEENE